MTQKDYVLIAQTLKEVSAFLSKKDADEIVVQFAIALKKQHPTFCTIKFGAYIQGIDSSLGFFHTGGKHE